MMQNKLINKIYLAPPSVHKPYFVNEFFFVFLGAFRLLFLVLFVLVRTPIQDLSDSGAIRTLENRGQALIMN